MTNPSKSTGTRFETEATDYLNAKELNARRTGSAEVGLGDIHFGILSQEWTLEAKAEREIDLPGYIKQLNAAVERRGVPAAFKSAVVVKNRRHSTGDAYAVMDFFHYRQLVIYVNMLELLFGAITGVDLSDPEVFTGMILGTDEDAETGFMAPDEVADEAEAESDEGQDDGGPELALVA